jgi:uncharacterized SAM-binding protein YcdF (DUF218 family)
MMTAGLRRTSRLIIRLVLATAVVGAIALLSFLPFAGRWLIVQHPLERSDAIVVLAGARVERWLEGVDLYRAGWAPRVVLSNGRIEEAELHLREMGIRFPGEGELARDAMIQMRVPPDAITMLPGALDNTAQEAEAVRQLMSSAGWRRAIVVTSKYHTRRTAFAFEREFRDTSLHIIVRASQHARVRPERWWTTRGDFRFVTSELQKLLAYRLGLGG